MPAPILLSLLCLVVAVPRGPDPQGAAQRQRPAPSAAADPAFQEVETAYRSALQAYDQARLEAGRGRAPAPTTHPAATYWPRMEAVARDGSARARQWLCENLAEGVAEPARRLSILERELDALLACCPSDPALFGPITALKTQAAVFGVERSLGHLERIATTATNPEVQARALLEQAFLVSDRRRTADSAKLARAREIHESVVLAFPATRAGRDAAELLAVGVQADLVAAMDAWTERVAADIAAGKPASGWPEHPFHAFQVRFEPLASTQLPAAKSWCESLYPSFAQAEKLAPELALSSLARDLGRHYPPRDPNWGRIRMRLLGLAVRAGGGDAPWIRSAVAATAAEVDNLPALAALPFTATVLELSTTSETRAQALWIEAQTRLAEGSEPEFERALAALDALVGKHKDMVGLVEKATALAAAVRAAMPGAPLPDSRSAEWALKDLDDLELVLSGYRGRVVLVDVFDAFDQSFPALVPERRDLNRALAGRPFALVGLCRSVTTRPTARSTFQALGVEWRCGLLQSPNHPYLKTLFARRLPTASILVDARGVIRARNRPFAEMARLAAELTAEAERDAASK